MSEKAVPGKRRIVLVDRAFQLKYAGILALLGVVVTMACGIATYLILRAWFFELEIPSPIRAELADRVSRVLWLFVAFSAAVAVLLAIVGVFLTHRIAGPVYAMSRTIAELARGEYPIVRPLREKDELKDFADVFQKSLEALRAREVEERLKLDDALGKLASLPGSPEAQEGLAALRALRDTKSRPRADV